MGDMSEDVNVTHIFMIAMSQPHEQVDTLAKLMDMFSNEELMNKLYDCSSKDDYINILKENDLI